MTRKTRSLMLAAFDDGSNFHFLQHRHVSILKQEDPEKVSARSKLAKVINSLSENVNLQHINFPFLSMEGESWLVNFFLKKLLVFVYERRILWLLFGRSRGKSCVANVWRKYFINTLSLQQRRQFREHSSKRKKVYMIFCHVTFSATDSWLSDILVEGAESCVVHFSLLLG